MLSLRQIINNMNKGQSAIGVRYILQAYEKIYESIKNEIIVEGVQKQASKSSVYLTIPSEKKGGKSSIVVLEINSIDKLNLDTGIKVYSNSPSFLWNFAYVFNQQDALLYPNKFPNEFKTMEPKIRNPYEIYGFEKHIFSAIKFVSEYKLKKLIVRFEGEGFPSAPTIRFIKNRDTGQYRIG